MTILPTKQHSDAELAEMRAVAGASAALPETCDIFAATRDEPPWNFTSQVATAVPCKVDGPNSVQMNLRDGVAYIESWQITFAATAETLALPATMLCFVVASRAQPAVLYTEGPWRPPHEAIVLQATGQSEIPGA